MMPDRATPWPHAPMHRLSDGGTYFVTASTYFKAHHFSTAQRLDVLQRGLLSVSRDFLWVLEAWAVFSNHYHFVARSPMNSEDASNLSVRQGGSTAWTANHNVRFGTIFGIQSLRTRNHISRA
jgi:REP element-mobilizing transposase RayT